MRRRIAHLLVMALFITGAVTAADTYEIDPVHSYVGFSVRHLVISTVKGNFTEFSGSVIFDSTDRAKSSINVSVKAASINTDNNRRDDHLRSPDFFDAANFPEITFVSDKIEKTKDGYRANGKLTLHGITKDLALPFEILGVMNIGDGGAKMGVDAGPLSINRQEYGLKWSKMTETGGLVVSDEVKIEIHLELNKKTE